MDPGRRGGTVRQGRCLPGRPPPWPKYRAEAPPAFLRPVLMPHPRLPNSCRPRARAPLVRPAEQGPDRMTHYSIGPRVSQYPFGSPAHLVHDLRFLSLT